MSSPPYQVLLLGNANPYSAVLRASVAQQLSQLGLPMETIRFLGATDAAARDPRAPQMVVFFGGAGEAVDTPLLAALLEDSVVIAPLASSAPAVPSEIPPALQHINAMLFTQPGVLTRLASLILETFRLLRRERRIFISYRRRDSQPLANRLYDALDARGFDVFIDVRSVPPAVDFQAQLWHRLSDSDVVILIDTPGFRQSRWTTAELARATATNIQILHLLWPGQVENADSAFSYFFTLDQSDFSRPGIGRGGTVKKSTIARICEEAERLRARAIAARHRYLVDNFCDAARDVGLHPVVQPHRWISVSETRSGRPLAVIPAVGVPTSDRIKDIFDEATADGDDRDLWLIYDNRGVLNAWLMHLDWLDRHLPVRTLQMARVPELVRELR